MWRKSGARTPVQKKPAVLMEDESDPPRKVDKSVLSSRAACTLIPRELRCCVLSGEEMPVEGVPTHCLRPSADSHLVAKGLRANCGGEGETRSMKSSQGCDSSQSFPLSSLEKTGT